MLHVVLAVQHGQKLLADGRQVKLFVDEVEFPREHYFHQQYCEQNGHEYGDDEADAQADAGDMSNLTQGLIVLVLQKDIMRGKQYYFILFLVQLKEKLHVDFVETAIIQIAF
jgi:hypothetical protein